MRFPDFNDDWTQTTLGEIAEILSSQRVFASEYKDHGIPFYRGKEISELRRGHTPSDLLYISKDLYNEYQFNYGVPQLGDILITAVGTLGNLWIVDDSLFYFKDGNIIWLKSPQLYPYFLYSSLEYHKKNLLALAIGSSQKALTIEGVRKLNIAYPTSSEQKKIADFLSLIDERITNLSETIKELKTQKAALRTLVLNTMITKWIKLKQAVEQGTISLKRGEIIPKQSWSSENIYPVYSSSSQNKGLMGFHKSYMFDKELISWSIDGGGYLFYRPKHRFNVTNVCGVLETNDFDYMFLCEALKEQHSKLSFDYQNKAHPSVIQELYDIPVLEITKQQYYGKFFLLLDERIEVEEQLLKKYEEQKKYLLRHMFV